MAKRVIEFHEVVVRFAVRTDDVVEAMYGFPVVVDWMRHKFGRHVALEETAFDSEERRSAVARIVLEGIGNSNAMSGLEAEGIVIEVDGSAMIDDGGAEESR